MFDYTLYFILTLVLSSIFAMAGLGSAVALVPALHMSGINFDLAKTVGLFVNFSTTATNSLLNIKKDLFDKQFVLPLVVSSMFFAYFGAKLALSLDPEVVKKIFALSLILIASMILFLKVQPKESKNKPSQRLLLCAGSVAGVFSGFLGIGGGSVITPILILAGYDPKKIALGITFVIPFSSIVGMLSYASEVQIDYTLFGVVFAAAILGGYIGNYMLHFKISSQTIKKIIAVSMYILALKMILG